MRVARVAMPDPNGSRAGLWQGEARRPAGHRWSDSCYSCRGSVEFQQVVSGTDHRPLLPDAPQATSEKLPEATSVFDLPENRFGKDLTPAYMARPRSVSSFLAIRCLGVRCLGGLPRGARGKGSLCFHRCVAMKGSTAIFCKLLIYLVDRGGIEPPTS